MEHVKNWEEKIEVIRWRNMGNQLWFRGHGKTDYKLKPNIARSNHDVSSLITAENETISNMMQEVPEHELGIDSRNLIKNEWLSLMQAQHLGYQTRLLDWTLQSRLALFFAVENEKYHNVDGHLYILSVNPGDVMIDEQLSKISPKDLTGTTLINAARSIDFQHCLGERRRTLQMGMFSVSSYKEALIALEDNQSWNHRIVKEIIPAANKKALKDELAKCGLTHEAVYVRQL